MAPGTGVLLVLLGLALAAGVEGRARPALRHFTFAAAAVIFVAAAWVLARGVAGFDLSWEAWLIKEPGTVDGIRLGRISPLTAAVLVAQATALLALVPPFTTRHGYGRICAVLMLITAAFCGITALAYLVGTPLFYEIGIVPIAFPTAISLAASSLVSSALIAGELPAIDRERRVQTLVLLGFSAVVVLLTIVATIAYVGLAETRRSQRVLVERNFAAVLDLARLRSNIDAERLDISLLFDLPSSRWTPWYTDLNRRIHEDEAILGRLPPLVRDNTAQRALLMELQAAQTTFSATRVTLLEHLRRGRSEEARALYLGVQTERHARLRELLDRLETTENSEARAVVAASDRRAKGYLALFAGAGGISVLGAVGVGFFIHRAMGGYLDARKAAEEALRRFGDYNRSLLEASLDPLVAIGPDGTITDVNAATEAVTGRPRAQLIGTDFSEYFTDPDKARAGYELVFQQGIVRDYPLELRHRDGGTISVLYNASVYRDETGAVTGVFAAARDITARKRIESELQRANRALRATSGCDQAIVHAETEAGLFREVCRAIVDQAGYRMAWIGIAQNGPEKTVAPVASAGNETGYLAQAHITWADDERGRGPTGTAIRSGQPSICRNMLTDPRFAPWRDEAQARGYASSFVVPLVVERATIGALCIYAAEPDAFDDAEAKWLANLGEDVSFGIGALRAQARRAEAEQALARANAYNRSLIEASLDPLVTIGSDGRITDANPATEAATGRPRAELVGSDFSECFTEPDKARAGYERVFHDGFVRDYPLDLRHRDGTVRSVVYNASLYRNEAGAVLGVFAAARDITERKQAEEKIRRYADELERSNQELERFAYVASHDLQEPLRTISSFSELLADRYRGRLDRDADEFIEFIVGGAARMQALINDLLAFSRVGTRGKPFARVDCNRVLTQVLSGLDRAIRESGATVSHGPLPQAWADETQLAQVFQNLVGNAIKFRQSAQPPRVQVAALRQAGGWEFSVADNGIGIDPHYFDRIFIIFQRLHGRDEYPGTGIGLAICKKIVERHGGRIWVESSPGSGSTFHFLLPDHETP